MAQASSEQEEDYCLAYPVNWSKLLPNIAAHTPHTLIALLGIIMLRKLKNFLRSLKLKISLRSTTQKEDETGEAKGEGGEGEDGEGEGGEGKGAEGRGEARGN